MKQEQLQEHQQERAQDKLVGGIYLAQTFLVDDPGGNFLTSIDLFFQSKLQVRVNLK